MLKFVNKSSGKEEAFLYSKAIPRLGDSVLKNGVYYRVEDVIFDDDEGDIIIEVSLDSNKNNNLEKVFAQVPRNIMDRIKQLLKEGEKLKAVKLLKEVAGTGLREAKDFCDNLQN